MIQIDVGDVGLEFSFFSYIAEKRNPRAYITYTARVAGKAK